MEFEQIVKRLEWLDEQQRKNKSTLSGLDERLTGIETTLNAVSKQMKDLRKQLSEMGPSVARLDQFDEFLSKQRTDTSKALEAIEARAERRDQEVAKRHEAQLETVTKSVSEMRTAFGPETLKREFKERLIQEERLSKSIAELYQKVEKIAQGNEQVAKYEEGRRQDLKRFTDIQGELTALRKRADENREKAVLHTDGIRNLENRLKELFTAEAERRESQSAFLEAQAGSQVERDRAWKDWQEKYETFKLQVAGLQSQFVDFDEMVRSAKRAQETYNELNQKLDRRVSEVTEMQRLAEDRLRQEWVAFKADEQKRWTGHALSQEETLRELRKDMDKLEERVTQLDDSAQTLQDQLEQTTHTTEQQLQELMNVTHEWLSTYQRVMGHAKKPAKTAR